MAKATAKKSATAPAKKTALKKPAKKAATKKATVNKSPAKKAATKKTATAAVAKKQKAGEKKDKFSFKYSDKSAGQSPVLLQIWEAIRDMMLPYEKGVMKVHGGSGGQITLINHKPVEIFGRKRDALWFAAALIQKGYVGYYLMPVYGAEGKLPIKPELMKCLKGKACFHIKKSDPEMMKQIKESLKLGYEAYKKRGWI